MPKNSAVSHEDAVKVTEFFTARCDKIERKAVRKLGKPLSAATEKRMVQGVDREVEAKFGFPMRKLFEL